MVLPPVFGRLPCSPLRQYNIGRHPVAVSRHVRLARYKQHSTAHIHNIINLTRRTTKYSQRVHQHHHATRRTHTRAQHPANRYRNTRRVKTTCNLQNINTFNRHIRHTSRRPVLIHRTLAFHTSRLISNFSSSIHNLVHHVIPSSHNAMHNSQLNLKGHVRQSTFNSRRVSTRRQLGPNTRTQFNTTRTLNCHPSLTVITHRSNSSTVNLHRLKHTWRRTFVSMR